MEAEQQPTGSQTNFRYSHRQIRRARDFLARLHAARRAVLFYPLEHPATREAIDALAQTIREFHDEGVDLQVAFHEGEIVLGEQLLTEESVLFDQLIRDVTGVGAGALTITRGVTDDEIRAMVVLLGSNPDAVEEAGGMEAMAQGWNLRGVLIQPVSTVGRVDAVQDETGESARVAYGSAVSLLREVDRLMRSNREVSAVKVKTAVRSLVDSVLTNRYAMLQLTGLKNYDEYTFFHSANVAILSLALGSSITQDYRFLSSLGVGALLHDIGKLTVDQEILNKEGALTPEEWAIVRRHPVSGAQVVAKLPGVDKSAVVTILEHHMRFDGTGYPARTPSRRQHLASRIVAIADSYDAMTSKRSYSAARVQDDAMSLLAKCAGASLDPALVRLFIRLVGLYPPRSVVRLSGGEIAVVVQPNSSDPLRPIVRVIASPSGEMLAPTDLDLALVPEVSVEGCIDPRLVNIDVDDYL